MRAAALSVCDYITHFIALFSNYQSQSMQAPLQQITMDPHHITVPSDDDVVTSGAMFENPLFIFFFENFLLFFVTLVKNFFCDIVFEN